MCYRIGILLDRIFNVKKKDDELDYIDYTNPFLQEKIKKALNDENVDRT